MTAPTALASVALAGVGSLFLSSAGVAETRMMSDPDGAFVLARSADPPGCCVSGDWTILGVNAGSGTTASAPVAVAGAAPDGPAISGAGVSAEAPAALPKIEVSAPIAPAQPGWRQFLSDLVQNSLAAAKSP
jgi:hypothetical protein